MGDTKFVSLQELIDSIDLGLDIVFYLDGAMFNISWRDNRPFLARCPDGDADFYDDAATLVAGAGLDKRWRDIVIRSM